MKTKRRRLTPLEKRLRAKYTRLVNPGTFGAEFIVWDRICQGFRVVDNTTKQRAEWYRDMLAIALARLVKAECTITP